MKKKIYIYSIFLTLVYCCQPTLYLPNSEDLNERAELISGRKLYVSHCSSCHNLHLPQEFSHERWQHQLDEMQQKAKITDKEKQLIYNYLTSSPIKRTENSR